MSELEVDAFVILQTPSGWRFTVSDAMANAAFHECDKCHALYSPNGAMWLNATAEMIDGEMRQTSSTMVCDRCHPAPLTLSQKLAAHIDQFGPVYTRVTRSWRRLRRLYR